MLPTVLNARDKWLVPKNGIIMPDIARLWVCGIEDYDYKQQKIGFWDNVYGIDMKSIGKLIINDPLIDKVDFDTVVTDKCKILDLDLYTCKDSDLDFVSQWKLKIERKD